MNKLENICIHEIKNTDPRISPIKNLTITETFIEIWLIIDRTKFVKILLNKADKTITNIINLKFLKVNFLPIFK